MKIDSGSLIHFVKKKTVPTSRVGATTPLAVAQQNGGRNKTRSNPHRALIGKTDCSTWISLK